MNALPLAAFGNLMGMDGLVILIVLLLLFGAKKLPELARGLGQSLNEFRKARDDFEHELRAGAQDGQPRAAADTQSRTASVTPVAVPTQSLPYNPAQPGAAATQQSPEALQQQVEQLQTQLRALEAQKAAPTQPS